MSRTKRLAALEGQLAHRQHQAELEDLREIAEIARGKLLNAIARHKRGEPIPESTIRHDSPAHQRLQARFNEIRDRFKAHGAIRDRMP
jgi:rhodanese-related sulfurtransferase